MGIQSTHLGDYYKDGNSPYKMLAVRIIEQAVSEYYSSYSRWKKTGYGLCQVKELEEFFKSQWFETLSLGLNGETVLSELRKKANRNYISHNKTTPESYGE